MSVQSARLLSDIADIAARNGTSEAAFMRMAHRNLSCALVNGMGNVYATSLFATARAAGRKFQEGDAVAVGRDVSDCLCMNRT